MLSEIARRHHTCVSYIMYYVLVLVQAEDGDVWREVVRDGARAGGGETGPSPQPLSQRLSGLKPDAAADTAAREAEVGKDEVSALAVLSAEVAQTEKTDEGQASGVDLRLDNPGEAPWDQEGDVNSPARGPPKTPKRNKASSPQLADVSEDECCYTCYAVNPLFFFMLSLHTVSMYATFP